MLNFLFYDTQYLVGQGADFFSYYQAGFNLMTGLDCYAIPETLAVPYLYQYRYLPYFAYTFGAFVNLLPPINAYWLWIGILTVSLWLAVFRTWFLAKALNRPSWEGRMAMGMWLVFSPTYIELYLGQVTLFAAILLFFALTTTSFAKGSNGGGAMTIFWTLSSLTKLIPFLIGPVLLGAGRVRHVLVAALVTLFAIFAVPAGLEGLRYFLDFNTARSLYIIPYPGDHSLKMLLYYLLGEPGFDFRIITGLLVGVFLMVATFATIYSRDVWTCAMIFSTIYFFIMTDVWEHHYTFILPLLILAWIRGQPEGKMRWVPFALVLLLSIPILPMIQFFSGLSPEINPIALAPVWQIVYHSSKVVPSLIFFGWLLLVAYGSPREENAAETFLDAIRTVWNGLIRGSSPAIEGGILVRIEQETPH
ncbi:MAG: glycosyltransferase family 87 protein [Promethearchaeota archaeon]